MRNKPMATLCACAACAWMMTPPALADAPNCKAKISSIQTQLEVAKKFNNTNEIAGLQSALARTQANCTDAGLIQQAERKVRDKEQDVAKAQDKLTEATAVLHDAEAAGNTRNITKARKKLEERHSKLQEKSDELQQARNDLASLKNKQQ